MSFHLTEWHDWQTAAKGVTLHAGDVVRMNSWGAFADSIILGFNADGLARLSRPYAYVKSAGTTAPNVLTGIEQYDIPAVHITRHYTIVENEGMRAK